MKQLTLKRIISLLLAIMLLLSITACSSGDTAEETTAEETTAEEAEAEETTEEETEEDTGEITITDMVGRTVTIPSNVESVFSSSPACEAWLCALVPDRLLGWANTMSDEQLAYYPEEVRDLELIGGWYGYNEGNTEGIIAMAPDVVIAAYHLKDDDDYESAVTDADELSVELGTPVIAVSYNLEDAPEVMRLLGEWLGVEERGEELGDYLQSLLDKVTETVSQVPEDEVVSYYYAEDSSGLMTEASDSQHAEVFAYCGLECVADVVQSSFMGREEVSLEQVIMWDPDYIFVFSETALETIRTSSEWAGIQAVEDGNVYYCISNPQNWFDRSPNMLRVMGCIYVASVCYPDYVTYDLDTEIAEFFETLYNVELTDEQITALYDY